jgi:hypothetical protein
MTITTTMNVKLYLILLMTLMHFSGAWAQSLTISSTGQTGTSGTNWSISGNTLTVTGTANIQASVITTGLSGGNFTVVGSTNAFVVNVTEVIESSQAGSSLTIGSSENAGNITLSAAITLSGGLSVYGGYINVNANITSAADGDIFFKGISSNNPSILVGTGRTINKTAGTGTLTLQGHGRVTNSGSITTSGTGVLNVILWSDFDNSNNDGGVSQFGTISTNGGHVWLGGSSSNGGSYTWNGLTVGDGPSIGSAGFNGNALDIYGNITTNGGDFLAWAGAGALSTQSGIATDGSGDIVSVGSGDIILITDMVLGSSGDAIYFTQSGGTFTLVPHDGSFRSAFNWFAAIEAWIGGTTDDYNFGGDFNFMGVGEMNSLAGLTIGYYDGMLNGGSPVVLTNSSDITIGTATSIPGPISVYGGNIFAQQNLTSTLTEAPMLLQANGYIVLSSSRTIQTNEGDITFRANALGTAVVLPNTTTGAITLNSGSSILSNGGNITLGGNFSGTQGDGLYAASARVGGSPGILIINATITAAGGHVNIYGRCTTSYDDGVRLQANISTTGSGQIGIYGDAHGGLTVGTPDVWFGGITFITNPSTIETENGNITVEGVLRNAQSNSTYGLNFYRSTYTSGTQDRHIQIISKTGDIQITGDRGTTGAGGIGHSSWGHIYFGSPLSASWTASGAIKFSYSSFVGAAQRGFKVKTTGAVTYEPTATSFVNAQTFPLNSNYTVAESASSLTIGKLGNTANVTINAAQSIDGPISIYAGTITLNAGLTSTNDGDISFYSNNAIAGLTASAEMSVLPDFLIIFLRATALALPLLIRLLTLM